MFSLEGKSAIVTGAGSGIGRAIAQVFAAQGAHVSILELNEAAGMAVADEIRANGGSVQCIPCDVSEREQVERAFAVACESRKLDILVNNAGISHVGNVQQTTDDDMDKLYRVNVKSVYLCLQAGVERMLAGGGGVILNLASIASLAGLKDRFAYSMSKGAVLTMTYSVAIDYIGSNIRCNCVCPARVHTPFVDGYLKKNYPGREEEMFRKLSEYQPIGRMGKPEEVAALVLYLCSDAASFITGAAYPIDGGVLNLY